MELSMKLMIEVSMCFRMIQNDLLDLKSKNFILKFINKIFYAISILLSMCNYLYN